MIFSTYLNISILSLLSFLFTTDKHTNAYTLIVFEGSDWCVNCIRLEKNVLQTSAFKAYATQKMIAVKRVDFPQRKKLDPEIAAQNEKLADQYRFKGEFPTLLLIANGMETNIRLSKPTMQSAKLD